MGVLRQAEALGDTVMVTSSGKQQLPFDQLIVHF